MRPRGISPRCAGAFGGALDEYDYIFIERIAEYRANPPGAGWDGVYRATSK